MPDMTGQPSTLSKTASPRHIAWWATVSELVASVVWLRQRGNAGCEDVDALGGLVFPESLGWGGAGLEVAGRVRLSGRRWGAKHEIHRAQKAQTSPEIVALNGLLHVEHGKGDEDGEGNHFLQNFELGQAQ